MPKTLEVQASFSGGEVTPEVLNRRDAAFYYQSVSKARNCQVQVQGGLRHAGGTWLESALRNPLTKIDPADFVVTGPNGGTVAYLTDDDEATEFQCNASTGAGFVVFSIVMDATTKVEAVDLSAFYSDTDSDQELTVQVKPSAGSWTDLFTVDVRTDSRTRRFALAPAMAADIDEIQLICNSATPGKITIAEMALWLETGAPGEVTNLNYNFSIDQQYTFACTAENIDVFRDGDGIWLAAIPVPLSDAILPRLNSSQPLDSMTLFHEDLQTKLIERQELETEWNIRDFPFENIPEYDYGEVYTNGQNAGQDIALYSFSGNEAFTLTIEGNTTKAIKRQGTGSGTATRIKSALEALPNIEDGLIVSTSDVNNFTVKFGGDGNSERPWDTMVGTALSPGRTVSVVTSTAGLFPGEAIMSQTRGWPRCGGRIQQRQIIAGFKDLPLTLAASNIGDEFDFNDQLAVASGGVVWPLDSDRADGIVDMVAIRSLIIFTENEAYYNVESSISATETPDFRKIDQMGIEPGVSPVPIEGGLLFMERGGQVLRNMDYSDIKQSFATGAISTLSGHLLNQPVDMARRRPISGDRGDLVYLVNSDGTVIMLTIQKAEQVLGFTMAEYQGQVKAVTSNETGLTRYAVRRTLGGVTRNWLERHDSDLWLEAATRTTGSDITSATGLENYNGEDVRVLGDLADEEIQTVAGGTVSVAMPADEIIVGFDLFPEIIDMPVIKEDEAKQPLGRLKRCHSLKLDLYETTSCAVQVNGGEVYDLPLDEISEATYGSSIADRPFTGTVELQGFMGFTKDGTVKITQVRPGALTVKSIKKEMVV